MSEPVVLKRIMKEKGYTGYRLAKEMGVASGDIYCALNGTKFFYPGWRKKACAILGVTEAEAFPEDIAEMRYQFDEKGIVPPAFGWDVAITSALAELGKVKASGKVDGNIIKGLECALRELLKMSDLFVDAD